MCSFNTAFLSCLGILLLLSACASNPTDGYYDTSGRFIPYNPQNRNNYIHSPNSAAMTENPPDSNRVVVIYDRPGYYDYNGYYIAPNNGLSIPQSMLPPRGMCRIWFPNRSLSDQPPVESCEGIQSRVPMGAYVVSGGK